MNSSFGIYWPGSSFLHKMDPRAKLLAFVLTCVGVLWPAYLFSLLLVAAVLIWAGRASSIPIRCLFNGWGAFVWILCFGAAAQILERSGREIFGQVFVMGGRVLIFLIAANLFTLTTSPFQLGQALRRIFGGEFGFMVTLVFRFFPVFEEERVNIARAQILRGAPLESANPIKKMSAYPAFLIPLFVLVFKKAEKLAKAMVLRSFSPSLKGKPFHDIRWKAGDTVILLLFALTLGLVSLFPKLLPNAFHYPLQ